MSYNKSYQDKLLRTKEDVIKEKRAVKLKRWFFCITLFVIFIGFILISRLNSVQIKNIKVNGTKSATPEDVSNHVYSLLEGKWLYVFPKKSILLLPDSFLVKELHRRFPKFEYVEVKRSGIDKITININEYEGVYLWCLKDENCSFMDNKGVVFMQAPFFSGSAYIKIFVGEMEDYPFVPISDQELKITNLLLSRLRAINIEPTEFYFKRGVMNRLEVIFIHNNNPAKLIFDTSLSTEMSLDSLYATVRTDAFIRKYRSGVAMLEYIDVTLPTKVVYRFK